MLTLATRLTTLLAAAGALYVLTTRRSAAEQGFYFVFTNAFAVTQLLEIGAGSLIVQLAGNAATRLAWTSDGALAGAHADRARIAAILRQGIRWYACAGAVLLLLFAPGGVRAFGRAASDANVAFATPWVGLVTCAALYLPLVPFICVIEGSGRFVPVQRMRLVQALFASLVLVAVLPQLGALHAVLALAIVSLAVPTVWLLARYRGLLGQASTPLASDAAARPLGRDQWRTAGTWTALWAAPQSLTMLVLSRADGADAGRVGFGLALALVPATLCVAWLQSRYPRYAVLVARGDLRGLDALARRATREALLAGLGGAGAATMLAAVLSAVAPPTIASRVASPMIVGALACAALGWVCVQAMTGYLRAFRREPLLEVIAAAVAIVIAVTAVAAGRASADATALVHAGATIGLAVPMIALGFLRARRELLREYQTS